jgi:hypothetical protein
MIAEKGYVASILVLILMRRGLNMVEWAMKLPDNVRELALDGINALRI